jgi:hypothetical protein
LGATRHVLNRGDHWEACFVDGDEPESFLAALVQACAKTD